jgi:hypothetical protein
MSATGNRVQLCRDIQCIERCLHATRLIEIDQLVVDGVIHEDRGHLRRNLPQRRGFPVALRHRIQ